MAMTVLRQYDPDECDSEGVPLDWEKCRNCGGEGRKGLWRKGSIVAVDLETGTASATCAVCDGHGSLKAAALEFLSNVSDRGADEHDEHRCEDCGHPMSEGTWEDPPLAKWNGYVETRAKGEAAIMAGREPTLAVHSLHFSGCDEGCRHDCRAVRLAADLPLCPSVSDLVGPFVAGHPEVLVEASWRPVDVRTLGWPHDLRPEKLAVLCLRCLAGRSHG
jgi:hypothetical protein